MAAGTPVVAVDTGATREYFDKCPGVGTVVPGPPLSPPVSPPLTSPLSPSSAKESSRGDNGGRNGGRNGGGDGGRSGDHAGRFNGGGASVSASQWASSYNTIRASLVDAVIRQMDALVADPAAAERRAQQCQGVAEAEFSESHMQQQYVYTQNGNIVMVYYIDLYSLLIKLVQEVGTVWEILPNAPIPPN